MTQKRKIIVHIATSADGYIARPDGSLDWLTSRPAPKGFYGMPEFTCSVDAKLLGRKTFDLSVEMGAPSTRATGTTCSLASRRLHPCLLASNSSLSRLVRLPKASAANPARTSG
jgi:dihydrofolate reductase